VSLCAARIHEWPHKPGRPGDKCKRCGHEFGKRKAGGTRPPPVASSAHVAPLAPHVPVAAVSPALRLPSEALARHWNLAPAGGSDVAAAAAPPPAPAVPDQAAPPAEPECRSSKSAQELAEMWAPWLADGVIAVEKWIIEKRGRVPRDVADKPYKELTECAEEILRRLLPDVKVGPWVRGGIAAGFCYASMRVNADKAVADGQPSAEPSAPSKPSGESIPISNQPSKTDGAGVPGVALAVVSDASD